ncbi:MAG: neutral/alkaline non-lysosomal ceramidase N-terminal domain-containing protein [Armatimonadota bacterium]
MGSINDRVKIGWAQADITPDDDVILAGQFHARVSEGVMDPVTATALAIESANGAGGQVVMVSCDLASISNELRDAIRERVEAAAGKLDAGNVFVGATHTHSAPDARLVPYGMEQYGSGYKHMISTDGESANVNQFGMWPDIGLEVMTPAEYLDFAAQRIANAIIQAWTKRELSGIAYGLGHAVVGRNRRLTYRDGTSQMYGKAGTPEFSHVEGYEDHSVYAMMTYDRDQNLTGMVVNVPCPSQVSEHIYRISADYWHETRQELRTRFGNDIFILPQCAPAGDQSPHVLIGNRAEERMWRLKGRDTGQNAPREEIALKIANAIGDMLPYVDREIDWNPIFDHTVENIDLPRRMISQQDVEEALEEARPFREEYERLVDEIRDNPEIRETPRWYTEVTKAYRRMERGERVRKRFELQKTSPNVPIEVHVVRIGDTAFATNPFELYLDYAVRIRELSKATQTFLIQKAGCNGTYLPSRRSIACGGYGSVPASTDVGPEGGDRLVDWTVNTINRMWQSPERSPKRL